MGLREREEKTNGPEPSSSSPALSLEPRATDTLWGKKEIGRSSTPSFKTLTIQLERRDKGQERIKDSVHGKAHNFSNLGEREKLVDWTCLFCLLYALLVYFITSFQKHLEQVFRCCVPSPLKLQGLPPFCCTMLTTICRSSSTWRCSSSPVIR